MTEITHDHVEWAVVDRLRKLLEAPVHHDFNVTQSYSYFTGILVWVKQRIFTEANDNNTVTDKAAIWLHKKLSKSKVEDELWKLRIYNPGSRIKPHHADFKNYSVIEFVKWLRDALAHCDGRKIEPMCEDGVLIGFCVSGKARNDKERQLRLTEEDLRRIGIALADNFCKAIRRGAHSDDSHFGADATNSIIEKRAA